MTNLALRLRSQLAVQELSKPELLVAWGKRPMISHKSSHPNGHEICTVLGLSRSEMLTPLHRPASLTHPSETRLGGMESLPISHYDHHCISETLQPQLWCDVSKELPGFHPLSKCICVSGNPHYHPHSLGNPEAHLVLACETRKKLIVKPLGITTHPDIANMDERCWLLAFEECRPFQTCLWMLFFQISSEKLNQRFVPSLWPGKHRAMT